MVKARFARTCHSHVNTGGVEPNVEAAQAAASRLHQVLVGTFSEVMAQLPDGYFDLVIYNDVIEHMPDHNGFLEAIKHKLADQGA